MSTLAGTSIPGATHKNADEERARRLHSSSSSPSHHVPMKIPDLRFEQSYLKGISKFVHTEHVNDGNGEGHMEVVKVDWGNVAWITFRDQMFMPLLQGLVWGAASQFIVPVSSYVRRQLSSIFGLRPPRPPVKTGEFTDRMRDWSKSLSRGAEANIALAK
ncbi:hypothetical protein SCHPADRAFT_892794 [Schizopora paradoxa]|uniref:Uncharacterized protein n=1 Tax=Schizopora paradoxa TaxID=27342 RepID=A0A0H2RDG0_9AGAM|nr:hypothetical protein SCHPADRAFT_892794 [Schizopora paradoxa]